MARLVGVLFTSHGGFTSTPAHQWAAIREGRSYRDDVPQESQKEMDAKWARTLAGRSVLRDQLVGLKPDVLVIIGDDQLECFDFTNLPSLAVYVGSEFTGRPPRLSTDSVPADTEPPRAPGHPALATSILLGLLAQGFDPAFMMGLPNLAKGMSHSVMKPLDFYTDLDIPTVPLLINAYYAPQITATRCVDIGRTLRKLIAAYEEDVRVVVIGSGGLWHTPRQQKSWLNKHFDRTGLELLSDGKAAEWAKYFDSYTPDEEDPSQDTTNTRTGVTGLPSTGGPQGGTRETLCWICAAAMAEGLPITVVDYIPIYASPVGNAFAFCTDPALSG